MIRRNYNASGQPRQWVLFEQRQHALFAAELAMAWHGNGAGSLEPRREILNAIAMHDDGWVDWDRHPKVRDGRPLAFDEMAIPDSLAIWTKSITLGHQAGPLEAFAIAGHFSRLLRTHDSWKDDGQDREHAEAYLAWSDAFQAKCAEEWTSQGTENSLEQCELGASFVRLFDALSLWLLCADRTEHQVFETPAGPPITLSPRTPQNIVVAPWPFAVPQLTVSAKGKLVAVKEYQSGEELIHSPAASITLTWHLQPE